MHDLVNDLAKYVCGDICFRLGVDTAKRMPKTNRHYSFAIEELKYWDGLGSLTDAKRLRTFIPSKFGISGDLLIPVNELFSKFKYLRVLSLFGYSALTKLPKSVSKLKYLCSLDLSHTKIKRLPDSICLLYNLEVLKLNSCESLEELPSNLHKLTNLCCLEFRETKVRRMSMHFGKLKNLQVLSMFYVGKSSESCNIQQLGRLNLHGELSIEELQNIMNPMDALAVDLKSKPRLVKLVLKWNREHILVDDPRKEKEVLENLQPSTHLKELSIRNYGGTEFASWFSCNSLSNVVFIRLGSCKNCVSLPSFGLLPSLKGMWISEFDGIVSIGAEFYGSSSCPFPSLETLYFYGMKEWKEWDWNVTFPRLEFLGIENCPKLKGVSKELVNGKEVYISGPSLEASYFQMRIDNSCYSLTTFPLDFFPKLCSLSLNRCRNLRMISQERTHTRLKKLHIMTCRRLESMPKGMHILLPSLTILFIIDSPKVERFPGGGLPSNLKILKLSHKLVASLRGDLRVNTCLKFLRIYGVDEVECFPEEGFLPLSLSRLEIQGFRNLKKVDYKGLSQLSSLEDLTLYNCPKLECLPEEGLPKSISILQITGCPLLKERCQEPEGQDWGKISHIQRLLIE